MTTWTGTLPTIDLVPGGGIFAADIAILNSALAAVSDAWTDFSASVAWSAASVNPVLGNGTVIGAYIQVGKLVVYQGKIAMGTTTTFGTGTYNVALPVAVTAAAGAFVGSVSAFGGSATARSAGAVILGSTTTASFRPGTTGLGDYGPTIPYTWANGMNIIWTVVYQAA